MVDLTGANLISYLLRIIRDIIERNPRFRNALADVTFPANTIIQWRDLQVIIKSVSTSGNRLSPDYFMCTQIGRAILAKVHDKEGLFIEWMKEIDKTRTEPEAGVFYLNVDAVNEQTRDVDLTMQQYKWFEGSVRNARGTIAKLAKGIDGTLLTAHEAETGNAIAIDAFESFVVLKNPCKTLVLRRAGNPLVPLHEYWFERAQNVVLCESTLGGAEIMNILPTYVSMKITDSEGYELRPGLDYQLYGNQQWIQLSPWSPPGSKLSANLIVKLNPYNTVATDSENIIHVDVENAQIVPNQVFIHTPSGNYPNLTPDVNGDIVLPVLLLPGEWMDWEIRLDAGAFTARGKKFEMNNFVKTERVIQEDGTPALEPILDSAGKPVEALPGLWCAVGDQVFVGDQVAIIVAPRLTETYEVFGSKENLSFVLEIKANDLQTCSDLSEMLKQQLLVMRRTNNEADGLTIFEATRDFVGQQRDSSGTAPSYVYTLSVTASADWKVYVPLVTRVANFEINDIPTLPDFQGKLQMAPFSTWGRLSALGALSFIPAYV